MDQCADTIAPHRIQGLFKLILLPEIPMRLSLPVLHMSLQSAKQLQVSEAGRPRRILPNRGRRSRFPFDDEGATALGHHQLAQ